MKRCIAASFLFYSFFMTFLSGCSKPQHQLIVIDSRDYGDPNFLMKFEEISRTKNTSTVRITSQKASSVGSSLFIMKGFYEIAKVRGFKYFTSLDYKNLSREQGIYIGGFTNNKDADIKKEFGEQFSYENDYGQQRKIASVEQYDFLFDKTKNSTSPEK